MFRDLKYLLAYLLPLSGYLGLYLGGIWSPGSIYLAFVILPILDQAFPPGTDEHLASEEKTRAGRPFFDYLLYLNLPLLAGAIVYLLYLVDTRYLGSWELAGMICNVGLLCGTIGINVAHELGHRSDAFNQRMAQALLWLSGYLHFFIEHNRGHHRHVSTPLDPATSRKGQTIYAFWVRSIGLSWWHAWQLEAERLRKAALPVVSYHNQMLVFQLLHLALYTTVYLICGFTGLWVLLATNLFGIIMLETVNYIEHYGLLRQQTASGRYEPVLPKHSWNSNHELGRIFLYELTRHSDHHFRATRKYQILRASETAPQLPTGYPGSMLMALLPPLWFRVMDRKLAELGRG